MEFDRTHRTNFHDLRELLRSQWSANRNPLPPTEKGTFLVRNDGFAWSSFQSQTHLRAHLQNRIASRLTSRPRQVILPTGGSIAVRPPLVEVSARMLPPSEALGPGSFISNCSSMALRKLPTQSTRSFILTSCSPVVRRNSSPCNSILPARESTFWSTYSFALDLSLFVAQAVRSKTTNTKRAEESKINDGKRPHHSAFLSTPGV